MALNGVGMRTSYLAYPLLNMKAQLEDLNQQLATGKRADSYAGQGADRGLAVGLRAQLSLFDAFASTATNVKTRLDLANLSLQGLGDISDQIKAAARNADLTVNIHGQTMGQVNARGAFEDALALLNTQSGGRYLFSGRATDTPATAAADLILNGDGVRAGLVQLIDERRQADLGDGLGRLVVSAPATSSVALTEDAAGSPFGLKLHGVVSRLNGAAVSGPAGVPAEVAVDFSAATLAEGDDIDVSFKLPDGSIETVTLKATAADPAPAGSFTIGGDADTTAANFRLALTGAVDKLAHTSLVAASAMAAGDDFFKSDPPQRVAGVPLASAVARIDGTAADTVSWYTGEKGADPARGTAVAKVDQSITVAYGARADEDAIRLQIQTFAVYAAVTAPAADPNSRGQLAALNQRIGDALAPKTGAQTLQSMQADFAGAQLAIKASTERQGQARVMTQSMLDSIEGVSREEVTTKILALQTSLTASYQTTAMLYRNSLVNYL
jgi:flagellin-like hook-associated protein FlgL